MDKKNVQLYHEVSSEQYDDEGYKNATKQLLIKSEVMLSPREHPTINFKFCLQTSTPFTTILILQFL